MQKKQAKSEITKSKILASAESEFSDKGFFGARVDEIAALAGVNKRMIYEHYKSKDGLYKEALLSVYKKLAECERQFFVENLTPPLAIKNIICTYFRFLEETPSFVRMLMWENLNNAKSLPSGDVRRLKEPTINYIIGQIKRGKSMGIFREDVDEFQIVISILNFGFSYFSNIHTLSSIFGKDMTNSESILERAEFVSNLMLKYLMK